MLLGYILLYVPDAPAAVAFYEQAFGLTCRFQHEGVYAEMETGGTRLGFVAHSLAGSHGFSYAPQTTPGTLPSFEIGLTTPDVQAAYQRAIAAGATSVLEPVAKPWGQTVSYVRDLNGFLVEICTPVG